MLKYVQIKVYFVWDIIQISPGEKRKGKNGKLFIITELSIKQMKFHCDYSFYFQIYLKFFKINVKANSSKILPQ